MYNLVPVRELLKPGPVFACFEMEGKGDGGLNFKVKTTLDVLFVRLLFLMNITDVK